ILLLQAVVAGTLTTIFQSSAVALTTALGLNVTGDVAINTNKLTVTASSGDVTSAGALSAATAAGAMGATQSDQESASATNLLVSPGRQQYHPSAAKAWVRFNGQGTVAITASYNVTSITDNGVGHYTVNFTTAFSGANAYACGATANQNGTSA